MPLTFLDYCKIVQQIAETRGNNSKISIFADFLKSIENEQELELAVQFTGEGAFSTVSGRRASVGSRTIAETACRFCEIDYERVFRPCKTATGSASEAIEKLTANLDQAVRKRSPDSPALPEMKSFYEELASARNRNEKESLMHGLWPYLTPLEIKFSLRVLSQGSLRIGFESRSIVAAIAKAFDQDTEKVRYTYMLTGSIGRTALLSYNNELETAEFRLFQPVSFMLASPLESNEPDDAQSYLAEEKLDGMRCQLHAQGTDISLFSRDLNDITTAFPDVVDQIRMQQPEATVMDGELCVFRDDVIGTFNDLQQRMGVKKPSKKLLEEFPVRFVAFDLLYADNAPQFDQPLETRRTRLAEICRKLELPVTRQRKIDNPSDIKTMFAEAIARGNEGLMLKKMTGVYEYGQRKKSWLKLKQPGGSFDTVIMYAHAGSGRRGGTYSDFTLGIRVADDGRYEEEFIPIGKAYGGYSNKELDQLNKEIRKLAVDRFGPTLSLKPGIVVEIEFDEIQPNPRTKAGYTLRFPRFRAIRWDLDPTDCDTLWDVEHQYQERTTLKETAENRNEALILMDSLKSESFH